MLLPLKQEEEDEKKIQTLIFLSNSYPVIPGIE